MRKRFHRSERFECGEGPSCGIVWGPIVGALISGGLGMLSARDQARRQREAQERTLASAEDLGEPQVWEPALPTAENILGESERLYGQQAFQPGVNPLELLGRRNVLGYAEQTLPGLIGAAQGSWMRGLDPGLDPYVGQMIDVAQRNLLRNYRRNVLPAIADRAQAVGGYGGSRQGVAEGIASEGLQTAMGDAATRLLSGSYRDMLGQQRAAWTAAPTMTNLGFMPAQTQMRMGAAYRTDPQAAAQNLQQYAGLMQPYTQPMRGPGGQVGFQPGPNPWTGAVQGASTGMGLYNLWQNAQNPAEQMRDTMLLGSQAPRPSGGGGFLGV